MMKIFTRIVFGMNAVYQLLVGIVFLLLPVTAIHLYGFPPSDTTSVAAHVGIRALGAYILLGGGISAAICLDPDRNPVLLIVMGILSALCLVCWGLTLAVKEVTLGQVGLDLVVQVLLLIAVLGYYGKAAQGKAGPAAGSGIDTEYRATVAR